MNINITIANKHCTVEGAPVIVCGNSDYTLQLTLDDDWGKDTSKTARFVYVQRGEVKHQDVVFSGSTVEVPVLSDTREVKVGIYEGNLQTTTPAIIPCQPSILCGSGKPGAPVSIGKSTLSLVANALKGSASGEVVVLKDVSPIEHEMAVKVDVPGATVTKCGKNLLNADRLVGNSITKDEETGVFTITQSGRAAYFNPPIPANTPITFSVEILDFYNGDYSTPLQMSLGVSSGTKYVHIGGAAGEARTYTFDAPLSWLALYRYKYNEATEGAYVSFTDLQVEIGDTFTGFEPYVEPTTYTADENGVVNGIVGDGEVMTLFAESGATVTAEYNRDINKAFAELAAAIVANT